jgi:hypothetical protein
MQTIFTYSTHIQKEIYYNALAYLIIEAEKTYHLLSAACRLRKESDVLQMSESQRTDGINSSLSLEIIEARTPRVRENLYISLGFKPESSFHLLLSFGILRS